MLIEIWPFEHECQNKNVRPTSNFWNYQICQQTADKISTFCLHFQLKSKQKGTDNELQQVTSYRSQKKSQPTKVN